MTQAVADVMHPGDHGSTFAASPLVASVARVALDTVNKADFLAGVRAKGDYLKERLEEVNSPLITEVRGKGLMVGADLAIPAGDVVQAGYKQGLLLVNAGPNTLRLVPPLTISRKEIDTLVERLTAIFAAIPQNG
jgi:acetylornithine/succinyldiaminopimelate/putrescine aminotransferase